MVKQKFLGGTLVVIAIVLLARSGGLEWLAVLVPVSLTLAFVGMRLGNSNTGFTEASKKG